MSCLKRLLHNVSTAVGVLAIRSSQQLWREWHVIGGNPILAAIALPGAITTAIIVGWIVITMVRP